ncbi:MAG TPA: hypothetical protein VD905_13010 [Flavobacteriales bacterium]|nr:hypothetical protein [Flavobacteriales bacterium]
MRYTACVLLLLLMGIYSCTKENAEELTLNANLQALCELDSARYTEHVRPIIDANCMSCHNDTDAEGGITLTTHADVSFLALDGILIHAIKQDGQAIAMPKDAPKMHECEIHAIELWAQQGALDN